VGIFSGNLIVTIFTAASDSPTTLLIKDVHLGVTDFVMVLNNKGDDTDVVGVTIKSEGVRMMRHLELGTGKV